jgi:ABC-type sulfate transport system permease component/ABC-type uncharacterized transport system YnjBCD ATPase subunit
LLTAAALVAAVLALPLVFLLIEASGAGLSEVTRLIFRPLTWSLLWNTVRLTAVVTVACAVVGTAAAWCVERTDLPGRRVWAVLVVVPLAVPDFVVSFGWHSLWTWAHGFCGAAIVMTLAVYPLVYLPVAASLRMADPGQEEVARSLGAGRVRTFIRITLGQARGAILGGCLLVALVLLAEYGAFEILGYQTFTTEIFTEFSGYSFAASCALSLVLVLLSLLILAGDGLVGTRGHHARNSRTGPMAPRVSPPRRLGWLRWPVLALFTALVLLALGVPVAAALYWMADGLPPALSGGMRQVAVTGLHKAFGARPVLTGVDLEVPAGSLTAILGPSGSGKTTLLRLLAGFERADAGTIGIGDAMVDGPGAYVAPERRRIGYVPQEGSLFPHLTVAGNGGFGLPARQRRGGKTGQGGTIDAMLETVGLGGLGRRYPHQLSGGPAAAGRPGPGAGHRAGRGAARRAVRLARRPPAGQRPRRRPGDLPPRRDHGRAGDP